MKHGRLVISALLTALLFALLALPAMASEEKTWSDLQNAMDALPSGATLVLDADYTAGADSGPLDIPAGKTLTIDLNGHTIDRAMTAAGNEGQVFNNSGTLTITGQGVITGGWNKDSGGAIANHGTLTINGGIFTGNAAREAGAIHNPAGATLTINGGTFTDNTAETFGGGAIVNYGTLTVSGGEFTGNHARMNGGAIWNNGVLNLKGGRITGNDCGRLGGGIHYAGGTFNLSGNPVVMDNATGNVELNNHNVTITGAISKDARIGFSENTSRSEVRQFTDIVTGTGAIDCFFSDDPGKVVGLDYFVRERDMARYSLHPVVNVSFEANGGTGSMEAGRLRLEVPFTLPECGFKAPAECEFLGWKVAGMSSLKAPGETITMLTSERVFDLPVTAQWTWKTFRGLQYAIDKAENGATLTFTRDLIGDQFSGRIVIPEGKTITLDLNGHTMGKDLSNSYSWQRDEGNFIINNGTLTIRNGTFSGGYLSAEGSPGGAIANYGTLNFLNSVVKDCIARKEAGAIYNASGATLIIRKGSFVNNYVQEYGGGAIVNYGRLEITDSSFLRNRAMGNGGAIWSVGHVSVDNVFMAENRTSGSGGAVYLAGGDLEIWSTSLVGFTGNIPGNMNDVKKITFNPGSLMATGTMPSCVYVPAGGDYKLPQCGYKMYRGVGFSHWQIGSDATPHRAGETVKVTADVQLTAHYDNDFIVNLEPCGGYGAKQSFRITNGLDFELPECPFTPKEGEVFLYWQVFGREETNKPGDLITITGNTTVEAVYGAPGRLAFDAGEGTGEMPYVDTAAGYDFTLPESAFTPPEAYLFAGWRIDAEDALHQPGETIPVTGDMRITAQYVRGCRISYDAGEGAGSRDGELLYPGDQYIFPECDFTAPEGKSFIGWQVNDGDVREVGTEIAVEEDLRLVARYEDYCVITFLPGEASGSMESVNVFKGSSYALPVSHSFTVPSGMFLSGWKIAGESTSRVKKEVIRVDKDLTLTAQWAHPLSELQQLIEKARSGSTIKLTRDYHAGLFDSTRLIISKNIRINLNGHTIDRGLMGMQLSADGYVFLVKAGGQLTITGNGTITGGGSGGNGGAILNYGTVQLEGGRIVGNAAQNGGAIYNAPGATLRILQGSVIIADNRAQALGGGIYNAGTLLFPEGSVRGNTASEGGGIYNAGGTCSIRDAVTIQGNRPNNTNIPCMVTWLAGSESAEGSIEATTVNRFDSFTLPECAFTTPEGMVFNGWLAGGRTLQPGDSLVVTKDTDITAQWLSLTWNITFDANGGEGEMEGALIPKGEAYALPENGFTEPEGMAFAGWRVGETTVQPGESIEIAADTTIAAQWDAIPEEEPTEAPTEEPTEEPTEAPEEEPTEEPTEAPTEEPTEEPTEAPEEEPTEEPAEAPEEEPTEEPTEAPAEEPIEEPTEAPEEEPTEEPAEAPEEEPTEEPTEAPAEEPAEEPTEAPAEEPAEEPAEAPAEEPAEEPAEAPAEEPIEEPTEAPAEEPAEAPMRTITFDGGGAEGAMEPVQAAEGSEFTLPECAFSVEGGSFSEWALTGPDGEGLGSFRPGDAATVAGDMTFTACWQIVEADEEVTFGVDLESEDAAQGADADAGVVIEYAEPAEDAGSDEDAAAPSEAGSSFGRGGIAAIIAGIVLIAAAAGIFLKRKKK